MGSVTVTMLLHTFTFLALPVLLLLPATNCVKVHGMLVPDLAYVGESVQLVCHYSMTSPGETLNRVEWRKRKRGEKDRLFEFDKLRGTQVIGLNVDMTKSNETTMTLTNLDLDSKGLYQCEVFTTNDAGWTTECLNVTDEPRPVSTTPPSISTEDISQNKYQPGSIEYIVNDLKVRLEKTEKALIEVNTTLHTEPPYMFVCASRSSGFKGRTGDVTYGSTSYSSTNLETGGLDTSTGVFTAGHPGIYSVSWSMVNYNRGGQDFVYLKKNGGRVRGSDTNKANQGRTMFVHLDKGNTLSLYCREYCKDVYGGTTLCISLAKSHEEPKNSGPGGPGQGPKW